MSAFFVFLGLALLVIGSNIFVDSASRVAYSQASAKVLSV